MNRRHFLKQIGMSAAAFSVCGCADAQNGVLFTKDSRSAQDTTPEALDKPNIILLMMDDLGYGDVGCYGNTRYRTPHIDALAANGMRLTDYHSNGPVCSPTRAALVTGRYQQRSGIEAVVTAADNRDDGLSLSEATFAEVLKQRGYATALFGKWHLGYKVEFSPLKQGFDEFKGFVSGNVDYQTHIDQARYDDWWHGKELHPEEGYVTHLITRHGLDFLERHKDKPFCLYLSHLVPHYPYQGPNDPPERIHGRPDRRQTEAQRQAAYKEMIEDMDRAVGEVIARVKQLGLEHKTFIFFCSDNGPSPLGSAGPLRGRKGSLWEGGHRVPGIAYWPRKIAAGTVNHETVMTMDLMPTMAALAGVPEAEVDALNLDGVNFLPILLENKTFPPRALFWRYRNQKAVRKGKWKLVKQDNATTLYNLDMDLAESNNLASRHPEIVAQLNAELSDWEAQVLFNHEADKNRIFSGTQNSVSY